MKLRRAILSILLLAACTRAEALEWSLGLDQSSQPFSVGFWPVNQASLFVSQLAFRNATYVRFGGGPSFSDEYYVLLPEHETSFSWYSGVELVRSSGADSTNAYTSVALDQVLLGDRYHTRRSLSIGLSDQSRLVTGLSAEPFFLHRPALGLSLEAAEDPFWSVLQAHAQLSGTLELGHSASLGLWAFPVAEATLDLKVPIVKQYLYLSLSANGTVAFPSLTPEVTWPEGAYGGYATPVSFGGTAEIRSRFLELEPIARVALELVLYGSATGTASALDMSGLTGPAYIAGAFLEGALEIRYLFSTRVQVGASYDFQTRSVGFLFALR